MKTFRWGGFLGFLLCLLVSDSAAQMFYVTSEPGQQLDLVDFTAGTVTDIFDIGSKPDSVIVNAQGQLFYTVTPLGTLQMFDPATGQDTVLSNLGTVFPRDLTFDPDGKSILVSLYAVGKLGRYNLATGALTIFPSQPIGQTVDGLAYDPAGNLFAVVARNTLCQLDPVTGAILQTVVLEPHSSTNGGDGLIYDSFTKNLWLTRDSTLGNGLIEIPLTEGPPPILGAPIFFQTGNIATPDGVISDRLGNLYIGEALQHLTEYNIPTDTIVKRLLSPGIDGLAFVPAAVPPGQFSISITPASISAPNNETVSYTLNITTTENPAPTFLISCAGLPSPAVCTAPGSAAAGNSQIQVQTQTLAAGSYSFSVSVTDGLTTQTASAQVTIVPAGQFSITITPASITALDNQTLSYTLNITTTENPAPMFQISCSGLPSPAVCTTAGSVVSGNSQVQVETQSVAAGTYSFSVAVTDGTSTQSASAQVTIGNFAASLSSSSVTIGLGQSGTVGMSVSSENGFSDPVTLSCSSPAGTTCSLDPTSVTPSTAGTPSTLTISVATRPASGSIATGSFPFLTTWTSLAPLGMLISRIRAKRRRQLRRGATVLFCVLCLFFSISCNGGKSDPSSGTIGSGSTPTTFTVSVQATSDNVVENAGSVTVTVP